MLHSCSMYVYLYYIFGMIVIMMCTQGVYTAIPFEYIFIELRIIICCQLKTPARTWKWFGSTTKEISC